MVLTRFNVHVLHVGIHRLKQELYKNYTAIRLTERAKYSITTVTASMLRYYNITVTIVFTLNEVHLFADDNITQLPLRIQKVKHEPRVYLTYFYFFWLTI